MTTEQDTHSRIAYVAYAVRDLPAREGYEPGSTWTRIGAAFAHRDGKGLNILLDALPIDGTISLRMPKELAE